MRSAQRNHVCSSDAEYREIERSLQALSPNELSDAIAKKVQGVLYPHSLSVALQSRGDNNPTSGLPILTTSSTLARLVDKSIAAAMVVDSNNALRGGDGSASTMSHEAFLWRCSLCGDSLLEKAVYSCEARQQAMSDRPAERFHHYCQSCVDFLSRCVLAGSVTLCPKCNRPIPPERNLPAESAATTL